MSLVRQYFDLLKEYKSKYGTKTFLLLQVGSFFEVYAKEELDENIQAFSQVCDLRIASKGDAFMAGFRDYVLDKYLAKIVEESYTAVVHIQEEKGGVIERRLHGIYSPGTSFVEEDKSLSNHFACVWLYKTPRSPSVLLFGISVLNIFTGKVDVFEYEEVYSPNPTTYDPLERFFSIYQPTETVLIHNLEDVSSVIQYLNLKQKKMTVLHVKDPVYGKQIAHCESQRFQKEILAKYYPCISPTLMLDSLFEKIIAFQSLCFLLDYVSQHNPGLTQKLTEPVLDPIDQTLILANHSLKQLNILDTGYTGPYSSVLSMLNTCRTKIGKRAFEQVLLKPSRDKKALEESYAWIEHCLGIQYDVSSMLVQLVDLEKWDRKRIFERVSPREYAGLHQTCVILLEYLNGADKKWLSRLDETVIQDLEIIRDKIASFLVLLTAEKTNELDDSCEFLIQRGIDADLDKACRDKIECGAKLHSVRLYLNGLYTQYDKKCEEAFKFHETGKSGTSIQITKRRWSNVKKLPAEVELNFFSSYTQQRETFLFHPNLLAPYEYNGQTFTLWSPELTEWTHQQETTADAFLTHLKRVYKGFHSWMNVSCEKIVRCIQTLDLMNTHCENIRKYNYCKPVIREGPSFVRATRMRHALIEHLETRETYVPNDVELGGDTQGVLLFGTNAVGKTSYIKSIGICVILAQAGMYVPCDTFEYYPYDYLFTRIIGNDNLFKGLSTFAVEMSELRVILQKANPMSLILGDELCSGTEMDSALSIFASGLVDIYEKKSSFIFATHFHTLQHFEEIRSMERLRMKHLTVQYNYEKQSLVYGRTLCDGPGESTYGLEVCKSLALPDAFLARAYAIRNRETGQGPVLLYKESSYNRDKIRSMCEFCKTKKGTEIHHLAYQKDAGSHHVSNLSSICESCHQHIHALGLVYERRKTLEGEYVLLKKSHGP